MRDNDREISVVRKPKNIVEQGWEKVAAVEHAARHAREEKRVFRRPDRALFSFITIREAALESSKLATRSRAENLPRALLSPYRDALLTMQNPTLKKYIPLFIISFISFIFFTLRKKKYVSAHYTWREKFLKNSFRSVSKMIKIKIKIHEILFSITKFSKIR